ncbi:MAG: hypothetical protein ACOYNC_07270 [Bacteroidales bacterium]
MKPRLIFLTLLCSTFFFSCKKEYTNVYNYYQTPRDSTVLITSPADSSMVHDTVPILYYLNKKLNIIRTECMVDFNVSQGIDSVPGKIYFYANTYEKGTIHHYFLRMIAKDGNVYNSNIITLIISKLTKPVLSVEFLSKSSLRLSWTDNSNEELGYHVFRKEGSSDSVLIGDLPKNTSSFTDNSLDTAKKYSYRVEVYSLREKFLSAPASVQFVLSKYMPYKNFPIDESPDGKIAFTPDGRKAMVTNYWNDNFALVDLTDGSKTYLPQNGGTLGLAMGHNGNFFITGSTHDGSPGHVNIWNLQTLTQTRTILPKGEPFALCMNKSDERVVVGGEPICIYNVSDGTLVKKFNTGTYFCRSVVYTLDESQLLTGGNDNLVKLWNSSTGELIRTYTGHTGHVGSVCFSPDESKIFSGSYEDHTVKIWDKNSGQLLKSIDRGTGIVATLLNMNGNVVAGSMDGKILIMTPDGETIQEFGDSIRILSMDYDAAQDMIAAYKNLTIQLYKKIGHWEAD